MLNDALEHLVKGIVDRPDVVVVVGGDSPRGEVLEVRVHPEDLGRVIGRGGRTARDLRRKGEPELEPASEPAAPKPAAGGQEALA